MDKKTILGKIQSSISEDGYLPDGFSLNEFHKKDGQPDFESPDGGLGDTGIKIEFGVVDGFMDGILCEHCDAVKEINEENVNKADRILRFLSSCTDTAEAMDALENFGQEERAFPMIDVFTHTLAINAHSYDLNHLKDIMTDVLFRTSDIESVKYVLEVYEVLELGRKLPDVAGLLRMLGTCDEFTLFVLYNMEYWDNPNEEIFYLAQHAKGWGRVHAVYKLNPETEDISDWLLFEGWRNEIDHSYLADVCYAKADVPGRMERGLTKEETAVLEEMRPYLNDSAK